jgi:hypothetical protein
MSKKMQAGGHTLAGRCIARVRATPYGDYWLIALTSGGTMRSERYTP